MTRRQGAALCTACHDVKKLATVAGHAGMDVPNANCVSCHDPHAQPKGRHGLLLPAVHLPFARGDCTECHTARGRSTLKQTGAALCVTCHPSGAWSTRKNKHAPLASERACLSCHGPHGGTAAPTLVASRETLCFDCHDRKQFEGRIVHAALKRGCTTCHDPHGSDGPGLLKEKEVATLCQKCHADLSKHFHRTTSDRPGPDGKPMTCTSCHSPHAAEIDGLLLKDPKRDLCVQCHDSSMLERGVGGSGGGPH